MATRRPLYDGEAPLSEVSLESPSKTPTSGRGKAEEAKLDHKTLMVLFCSLVLDLVAFTMILPLLPALLDYYGHNDQGGLYGMLLSFVHSFRDLVGAPDTPRWNSVLFGGLIGSMFSFLQFLSSPIMGAMSDVYGRKPMLILSMLGIAASYALWAVSRNFTIFVLARVVGGFSKGNISISTAIVTDVSPPEKRSKGMAVIGVAFSVGFIIGPLIGAFFSRQARAHETMFFTAPAMFALLLSLLDILFVLAFLKETLPAEKRSKTLGGGLKQAQSLLNPMSLFRFDAVKDLSRKDTSMVRWLGVIYFAYLFLYSGLEFTLTFLTHSRFQFDSIQQGKMFFVIGSVMVLIQGGYVRRLAPGTEMKAAITGMILIIPSFIVIGMAYHQVVLYCGLLMYAFASATVVSCLTSLVSSYGSVDQKGAVLGIFRSLGALARAMGPILSSTIYWSSGALCCYTAGALCLFIPLVMLVKLKATQRKD